MFIGHLNILFSEAPALCIQYVLDSILFLGCMHSKYHYTVCGLSSYSLSGVSWWAGVLFFKTSNNFIKKNKINICYSTQQPFWKTQWKEAWISEDYGLPKTGERSKHPSVSFHFFKRLFQLNLSLQITTTNILHRSIFTYLKELGLNFYLVQ